jgi:uncharacterized membrane protein YeaQ/YmgE (transglycosylase-associated protein family)
MAALVFIVFVIVILVGAAVIFNLASGLLGLIIPVIFWMLAGMFTGRLLRGRGYGPVGDVALGLVGGIVGSIVLGAVGLGGIGNIWIAGNIIVGVIGAVILVTVIRAIGDKNFAR